MNNLFDVIKKNAAQIGAPTQPATSNIQNVLGAKATGKAVDNASAPAVSTIGAQQAQQTAAVQTRAAVQEGQAAQANMNAAAQSQAANTQLAEEKLEEGVEDARSNILRQTSELLADYSQGNRTLDLNRDKARLEQIGFGLRLTNDEYLNKLKREGQKSHLNNDAVFKQELTKSIFADEADLLKEDLAFRSILKADARDFERLMADMNIDYALKIAAADADQANSASKWGAIGSLTSAGIEAGTSYAKKREGMTGEELDAEWF